MEKTISGQEDVIPSGAQSAQSRNPRIFSGPPTKACATHAHTSLTPDSPVEVQGKLKCREKEPVSPALKNLHEGLRSSQMCHPERSAVEDLRSARLKRLSSPKDPKQHKLNAIHVADELGPERYSLTRGFIETLRDRRRTQRSAPPAYTV